MNPTRKEIRQRVISSFHKLLGDEDVNKIDDATDPVNDLGLDSCDGVDYACVLSEALDWPIPDDLNPLVDDARHRVRTVGEVVNFLCDLLGVEQELGHG